MFAPESVSTPAPALFRLVPAPARTEVMVWVWLALTVVMVEVAFRVIVPPDKVRFPPRVLKLSEPALTVLTGMVGVAGAVVDTPRDPVGPPKLQMSSSVVV